MPESQGVKTDLARRAWDLSRSQEGEWAPHENTRQNSCTRAKNVNWSRPGEYPPRKGNISKRVIQLEQIAVQRMLVKSAGRMSDMYAAQDKHRSCKPCGTPASEPEDNVFQVYPRGTPFSPRGRSSHNFGI
ncbi:unnamed protein product, partial [Nezara viridula]